MNSNISSKTEFNNYLSIYESNLTLKQYFTKYHTKFSNKVDISFMDYFLYLCENEDKFVVDQEKLKEYQVINISNDSNKIKRALEQFDLVENEDYRLDNVVVPVVQGGFSTKKLYTLTPEAFKLCLIRAKNSKKYAKYYLLLEKVYYNYNEYEKLCKDNKILSISEENKSLHKKVDELLKYAKQTQETLEETNEKLEETNEKLDETNEKLEETNEKLDETNDKLEEAKEAFEETANRSVPSPKNEKDNHEFILMQNKNNLKDLKFIRGLYNRNERILKNRYKEYNIIKRDYNANPIQLFTMFKETMKEKYETEKKAIINNKRLKNKVEIKKKVEKIKFTGCSMKLSEDYCLDDLLNELQQVCDEKYIPFKETFDME